MLVSASNTSNYALTNPNTWPSGVFVRLIIESGAIVAGRGGKGGDACWYYQSSNSPPKPDEIDFVFGENGENGGNAILANYAITIDNKGTISGGGGGGGAGVAMLLGNDTTSEYSGGGGGGAPIGFGGNRGYIHQFVDGIEYYFTDNNFETAGKTATNTQGGDAGIKFCKSTPSPFGYTANGGKGGDLAQNGENGYNPLFPSSFTAGVGGTAGDAIHGQSFIVWENIGTIYGATS